MTLARPEHVAQMEGDLAQGNYCLLTQVDLPPAQFSSPSDFLLNSLDNRQGLILLVSEEALYHGSEPKLVEAFSEPTTKGWRPLTVLSTTDPLSALQKADQFLGLAQAPNSSPDPSLQLAEEPNTSGTTVQELVERARRGELTAPKFRDKETQALVRVLSKRGKNAACLVGPAGVGKTAIVENLAISIAAGQVPPHLKEAKILDINLGFLAAGASHRRLSWKHGGRATMKESFQDLLT